MGIFRGLQTKAATGRGGAVSHAISASPSGRNGMYASGGKWDTEKAIADGYEKTMLVWRCCDAIASNQAPIPIFQRKGDPRTGTIVRNPKLQQLLNVRPNIYETAAMFRYRLSTLALLSRRGVFIEIVGDPLDPESLHLIPPGMCEPIPDAQTFVSGYRVKGADMTETILRPSQVIWIRLKPHPTDPYAQMTPLVTAGIAAETDYFARLFNLNFLRNDGRPGLLVSVRGQLHPYDAEELKRRFGGGPATAGQTTVIEADGLDVADMGATPRDAQWLEAINTSKQDIMLAFGVPESILGNASGRTFDNADAEYELFWTHTMVPHCEALAGGMDAFTGDKYDDSVIAFDYRVIDVLQRQERRKRETAIAEYQNGAITWNEMRKKIGEEEWPEALIANTVVTSSGFAFTKDKSQMAEIMKAPNVATLGQQGGPGGMMLPPRPGGGNASAALSAIAQHGARIGAERAQRSLENSLSARALQLAGKAAVHQDQREVKEAPLDADVIEGQVVSPHEALRVELEAKVDALITVYDTRQEGIYKDRLGHAKFREGTRHWLGETKVAKRTLDPGYVVETERWVNDIRDDFTRVLTPVLLREAQKIARDMEDMGVLDQMKQSGKPINESGKTPLERIAGSKLAAQQKIDTAVSEILAVVEQSTRNQSQRIAGIVKAADEDGKTIEQIKREVIKAMGTRSQWRRSLSSHMTTSAIESVKNAVYGMAGKTIKKTWNAEVDERTRDSHFFVDGTTIPVDELFHVGETMMRFPGDPLAPVEETANCRCWLEFTL